MAQTVLIVDDEPDLVSILEYNLRREGFLTQRAATGQAALDKMLGAQRADMLILDWMLPDMPGTQVLRSLRAQPCCEQLPVLMLTARDDEVDRVVGFEMGADDYVTKPFSPRELLLRVRAILKRSLATGDAKSGPLQFGVLRLEPSAHQVFVLDDSVRLTALEFRLLSCFIARRGRVQTREGLLSDVWGIQAELTTRTVDTHVKRLREKLGVAGGYIETLRGVGYRFCAQPPSLGHEAQVGDGPL